MKIGFSKFAELRPRYCVLAGASGTHSVCICTIHQNVKLMILGENYPSFNYLNSKPYHDFVAGIIYNPPILENVIAVLVLKKSKSILFDHNMIENITFK